MKIIRCEISGQPVYGMLEENGTVKQISGSIFGAYQIGDTIGNVKDLKLLSPVEPSKVIGVGLNYKSHIFETGGQEPKFPILFLKPSTSVIGPDATIVIPDVEGEIHYEGELGVVIGKRARHVSEAEALSYVLGYTCGNDVSARKVIKEEREIGNMTRGKGFDTFCPLGPCIATGLDPTNLSLETRLNGETKQRGNTSDLLFSVAYLIADMSKVFTLLEGDVILTGTPSGIGPIEPGDVVEVDISGIGVLRNPVTS